MGLRINTNLGALTALRNLQINNTKAVGIFEKLSTGLAINRASDNPAGLVLLKQLEAETRSIGQAIENTQNAENVIHTADAGLGEISNILTDLRAQAVGALNTGGESTASISARQNVIDQSLQAINRIAQTTRFGDLNLLNGSLGFQYTNINPNLTTVNVTQLSPTTNFPANVNIQVNAAATQATAVGAIAAVQPAPVTFQIQGPQGTAEFTFQAGATQADVISAINSQTAQTGVQATAGGVIQTTTFGSSQTLNITNVSGALAGVTAGFTTGTDVQAVINGQAIAGQGNDISISSQAISGNFSVAPGATGTFAFTIAGGGSRFQFGPNPTDAVLVGFPSAQTFNLGASSGSGNLSTLATGQANSLQNNPGTALSILGAATTELSLNRSNLGGVESSLLAPIRASLSQQFENITASKSTLGDTDFALEAVNLIRNRILRESGVGVLKQSLLSNSSVLRLLT